MDSSSSRTLHVHAWIHFAIALITGGAAVAFFHAWYGYYTELWEQYPLQTISIVLLAIVAPVTFIEFLSLYLQAKIPDKQIKRDGTEHFGYAAMTAMVIVAGISYYTVTGQYMYVEWHYYPIRPVLYILLIPSTLYLGAMFLRELVKNEHRKLNDDSDDEDRSFAPDATPVPLTS